MVTNTRTPLRTDRLRALNVPHPVRVEIDERGRPVTVGDHYCPQEDDDGRAETSGGDGEPAPCQRIEEIIEIWRIDDEWWRTPISRRYVDVVLEGGGHVVLFEDLTTGQWFVQMP